MILKQEGIAYSQIESCLQFNIEKLDILIMNDQFPISEISIYLQYVKKGGTILCDGKSFGKLLQQPVKKKYVKYLTAADNSIFRSLGFLEIDSYINVVKFNGEYLDQSLTIFYHQIGEGKILCLPFDLSNVIFRANCKRKKFFDFRKELPSERVSAVSKEKFRLLLRLSLAYLLVHKNKPLTVKRVTTANGIFIFRIDTDFCSLEEAKKMYELCQQFHIKATWFVDTKSQENLTFYKSMNNQEIGFHCERHIVFRNEHENYQNIQTGLQKLADLQIFPSGFAAPFGEWNHSLQKAIENAGFLYSSEFCYDYDNLPSYPYINNQFSSVLQIPIHPISAGRLRRSHYSDEEKISYFKKIIDDVYQEERPVILYHHPHHQMWSVWKEIFSYVNEKNMQKMTMLEYFQWWKERENGSSDLKKINLEENQNFHHREYDRKMLKKSIRRHWRDLLYDYEHYQGKKRQ